MSHEDKICIQVALSETSAVQEPKMLHVPRGANLRDVLLSNQLTPYQGHFQKFNCQGMGICGSCKIWVLENGEKWERRSCQIQCFQDMEIGLQ